MKRSYRRVVAAVHETLWAILPSKLQQIQAVLELRTQGVHLPKEEIALRINQQRSQPVASSGSISVLNIYGTIAPRLSAMQDVSGGVSAEAISRAFTESVNNPDVSAIVLNIDSPGGAVGGIAELSQQIFEARGKKPIISVANGQMASAALWIGSAADEVVATPSATDIGSYGVMSIHQDDTKALEKAGIEQTIVGSTQYKTEGYGPMTESLKSRMQERVDLISAQFGADLARNYGVSVSTVNTKFGKGRTFLADEAVQAGLAHRISTLESVLEELSSVAGSKSSGATAAALPASRAEVSQKGKTMTFEQWCLSHGRDVAKFDGVQSGMMRVVYDAIAAGTLVDSAVIKNRLDAIAPVNIAAATNGIVQSENAAGGASKATPQATEKVNSADIVSQVNLAPLSSDAKICLIQSLTKESETLTYSQLLNRVNEEAVKSNGPVGATQITSVASEQDKFMATARDSILLETWGNSKPKEIFNSATQDMVEWKPSGTRDYSLRSPMSIARRCLVQMGIPAAQISGLDPAAVAQIAMGANPRSFGIFASAGGNYNVTGMFANIFYDASNVMLRRAYSEVATTYQIWAKQGESLTDFKPVHKVIAGELADPKAIPEDGEFEETTTTDGREAYRLTVWGARFSISWQAIVNDRLGAFSDVPIKQGRAMKRKQNKLVYNELKSNPTLSDGGALFNANALTTAGGHNNLATGAATPTTSTLSAMRARMRAMTGLNVTDQTILNIAPKWLLCGGTLEDPVDQILGSPANPAGTHAGVKNTWEGRVTPVIDSQLDAAGGGSDTAWYLAADCNDVDTLEYAYLQGLESPRLLQRDNTNALGMMFDIYQAFAVKALDFRGLQKHNGA